MKKPVMLVVLDGWGVGSHGSEDPIHVLNPATIEYIKQNYPSGALQASGISVGLPWNEEGNSEVGHLTLGIGRIIYQHYPRITMATQDGSFAKNEVLKETIQHIKKHSGTLHMMGLVGGGNIHSSFEHLTALITIAQNENIPFALDIITDGRDSDPHSAYSFIKQLPQDRIASISGRFYAMDRDQHWNFTQQAYQAITGEGASSITSSQIESHIQSTYEKKLNDEYIAPVTLNEGNLSIKDNDAVFIFNFREDRVRQIAESLVNTSFSQFPVKRFSNLFVASMTQIRHDIPIPAAFPPQKIETSLGKVLSQAGKIQLRIAETQKYAHVTFFFNGLVDKPFPNEYRVLIPSKTVSRQDQDPVMMAPSITARAIQAIEENTFDFILVNYANPDMIAHTGNYEAAKKAIQVIDAELSKLISAVIRTDTTLIVTSDHGNIERMFNPVTGEPETKHDISPVPIYLISKRSYKPQNPSFVAERERYTIGMLADIAPTVLEIMDIPQPPSMTGKSLLSQLLNQQ